jgi:hypothetical protein
MIGAPGRAPAGGDVSTGGTIEYVEDLADQRPHADELANAALDAAR